MLTMIAVTLSITSHILGYKIVHLMGFTFTVSAFISPLVFAAYDVVAEVYGYQLAKKVIWSTILCSSLFSLICITLIQLPSPTTWHYQSAYDLILGKQLLRGALGCLIGELIAPFINSYLLVKWKSCCAESISG